jgi:hypothetical protein
MQRISQRTRVPSRKVRANKGLDFTIYEDPAEGTSTPNSRSRGGTSTSHFTTKQPREASSRPAEASATPTAAEEAAPRTLPPKLTSILDQSRSARELRQNPATALFPMIAKSHASWDDPLKGIPGQNSYSSGALPAAPPIHERQVNLPEDLTDPIRLFTLFFPREHVETFVRSTNKYAEEKMELERKGDSELSNKSRYLNWKPLTTNDAYVFLGILILMGSDRRPKIEDYWRIPRAAGETPSVFHNYMSLKRFETIHRLFIASPSLLNGPAATPSTNDPPKCPPTPKQKPTARGAPRDTGGLLPGHWARIEPLASHIRETCMRCYTPGTHVIIDEVMLAFRGRSHDIIKLKNKPIGEGFKNWVLADHGYVWCWEWYSVKHGSEGAREPLDSRILAELPETQRMIMRLALRLLVDSLDYILYLDNLFTSLPLAKALKEASIGVTGITRKNTKGTPQWLLKLKEKNKELVWNSALGEVIDGVLIFLW